MISPKTRLIIIGIIGIIVLLCIPKLVWLGVCLIILWVVILARRQPKTPQQSFTTPAMPTTGAVADHTATMNGYRNAHHKEVISNGYDLVQVSSHGACCPRCQPYEGMILSLSGKDKRYPSLSQAKAAGLFHDGCRHSTYLWIEGFGDKEGPSQKYDPEAYADRLTQQSIAQRIRHWKKRMASASTDVETKECKEQIKTLQATMRKHIDDANARGRVRHNENWITLKRNSKDEQPTADD